LKDPLKEISQTAKSFEKMFKLNKGLVHVDISCCWFGMKDIEKINEGLKCNHWILGIHILGNKAKCDGLGFLEPENEHDILMNQFFTWIPA